MGLYESPKKILVGTINYYNCPNGHAYSVQSGFSSCAIYLLYFKEMSRLEYQKVSINIIIFYYSSTIAGSTKIFGKNEYIQIPNLTRDKTFKYDASNLYSSKPVTVFYKQMNLVIEVEIQLQTDSFNYWRFHYRSEYVN